MMGFGRNTRAACRRANRRATSRPRVALPGVRRHANHARPAGGRVGPAALSRGDRSFDERFVAPAHAMQSDRGC